MTGSLSESDDMTQETFIVAWRRLNVLRNPEQFQAWLYGIVRVLGRHHRSNAGRRPPAAELLGSDFPSPDPSPLERTINREEERILARALHAIPESYRVPLVLFHQQELSLHEMGRVLSLSESAVKMRLLRGRSLLREEMEARVVSALRRVRPGHALVPAIMGA